MQILVAEDERGMANLLEQTLLEEGHDAIVARNDREAYDIARGSPFDVIVLDVMMPDMDGFTVARKLRAEHIRTPILMLTARDAPVDIVRGLDAGADDYLAKPFSIDVLLARLRAVSRRGAIPRPVCLEVDSLKLDPATKQVTRDGAALSLTPREYGILELLMRSAGRVVTRDTILQSVWGFSSEVSENTLEVFVRQLRLKVDSREPKLIHTVRGFGYMLREP
jgi:two-component system, OmpR family, response regulator